MPADTDRFAAFSDIVTSIDETMAVLGTPMPQVLAKVTDRLDDVCRRFIAKSPFCLVASSDPHGFIDVSPKGAPAGFVRVLDDKHLAIPDRPFTFGQLLSAQAAGDAQVLADHGRPVLRLHLRDRATGLPRLTAALTRSATVQA